MWGGPTKASISACVVFGPPDIVPWSGIESSHLALSNDVVDNIFDDNLALFTYSVSAG